MFPVHNGVARRFPATITWTLIVVTTAIFLYQQSLPPRHHEEFIRTFALVPARYFARAAWSGHLWYMRYAPFLTSIFLHGGWAHLLLNLWTLWVFGPAVEDRLGHMRFLGFYLATGIAASVAHAVVNSTSPVPVLGASGAIAGVIGCYVRLFPRARLVLMIPIVFVPFFFEIPALVFAGFWLWSQIIPGVIGLMLPPGCCGIAWWAHIGGFCAGWLLMPLVKRQQRRYRRYYADEGTYGFLPDGRRYKGASSWV
ncbi:MAG: rhomboid family intramembrane serine protease [bacterium]|nr:rhomboid family intramembrane serine protease [bacterium]